MKTNLIKIIFSLVLAFSVNTVTASTDISQKTYPAFPRLTTEQLIDLANPERMNRRIFYEKASVGSNAKWFDAVKRGNFAQVKKMADGGQNLEVTDEASLGETALGWAAYIGYLDIVKYLVGKGANLYAPDGADVTHVLKAAISGGNLPVIEYLYPLMKDKVDLNELDLSDDETVLMVAVDNGRVDAVKWLLSQKVDVNIVAEFIDMDAFSLACRRNDSVMIELLTRAGAINHKTGSATCKK